MSRIARLFIAGFLLLRLSAPLFAEVPPEPLFDLQYVDMYVELFPETYEAEIISVAYLQGNGSDPVVLRCDGNFKRMTVSCDEIKNLGWEYKAPLFTFRKLPTTPVTLRFSYKTRLDGTLSTHGIIATNRMDLNAGTFWYPRNIAPDAHQVICNIVSDPGYSFGSNAEITRNLVQNYKRLQTLVVSNSTEDGLILTK